MPTPKYSRDELMKQRANLVEQARALNERANEENRDLHADEKEQYGRIMADVDSLKTRADREHELASIETELAKVTREAPQMETVTSTATAFADTEEYKAAFDHYLRTGSDYEIRSMQTGVNADGGFAVSTPTLATIVEFLTEANVMRGLVSNQTATGPFKVPKEVEQVTVSGVAELGTVLEDQAVLDVASFVPFNLSRITRASLEVLNDSAFNIEGYITRKLGQGVGNEEERLAIEGTGSSEPEGILVGATEGVTGGAIDYDGIIDLLYSVVEGYRNKGTFLGSDAVIAAIMKLTDSGNLPIWQPSVVAGQPDRLRNRPIVSSQHMPVTCLISSDQRFLENGLVRARC